MYLSIYFENFIVNTFKINIKSQIIYFTLNYNNVLLHIILNTFIFSTHMEKWDCRESLKCHTTFKWIDRFSWKSLLKLFLLLLLLLLFSFGFEIWSAAGMVSIFWSFCCEEKLCRTVFCIDRLLDKVYKHL